MATARLGTLLRHIHKLAAGPRVAQGTDRQLLDDFAARRDETAFTTLVARHGPMVLRVCRRVLQHEQDAEDAFQATFLVLARNPGSIRKREALANWLYGVAYRTAMRAKRSAARRRNHETRLRTVLGPGLETVPQRAKSVLLTWDEVQAVLDEEVQRLSAPFRAAFVLCVLEGKTVPEAARELACKPGTVSSRLTRARQRLQQRLAHRGIELGALLATLSLEGMGQAAVPAALAHAVVRSGRLVAAGQSAAGVIPTHVAALAAEVSRAMFITKTKVAVAILLAAGVVSAACGFAYSFASSDEAKAAQQKPAEPPASAKPQAGKDDKETITYSGRVLGPDNQPVAGAKLYLTLPWDFVKRPEPSPHYATTGEDGRFNFAVPKAKFGDQSVTVVATATGYGPAWVDSSPRGQRLDLMLKLVKDDVPIAGQIVDLQGKPVQGATVRLLRINAAPKEDLGPWLEAAKRKKGQSAHVEQQHLSQRLAGSEIPALSAKVTTDTDGRFQMSGIGRDRVVTVRLEGSTIASQDLHILTRPGKAFAVPEIEAKYHQQASDTTYYPASFKHVAGPTKPVVGVVRDKDTQRPLAGVTIKSYRLANNPIHGLGFIETKTDGQGRYRLTGMPKGKDNKILAEPREEQPYLVVHAVVPDTDGLEPVTVDFELKRGIWIEGKITDKATGRPLPANVTYFALATNPNLRDYPGLQGTFRNPTHNGRPDGKFRVLGIPGPGFLAVQESDLYLLADERDDAEGSTNAFLSTAPHAVGTHEYNALARIDASATSSSLKRDIVLDPGETITGTLIGPDDKPLSGVRSYGLSGWASGDSPSLPTASFTVRAFNPRRPRPVLFQHAGKQLVGALKPPKDESNPVVVKLQPGATVTGRLVDADGQPRADVELELLVSPAKQMLMTYAPGKITTDKTGRFRIETLLPGLEYRLGEPRGYLYFGDSLRSGETKDLGDVQLKANDKPASE